MTRIIDLDRSIIPACDVRTLSQLKKIVNVSREFPQVKAYKIGFSLGLRYGLPRIVSSIKKSHHGSIVIYDHQKAGTDIPKTAKEFAATLAHSGIDAAIIFPMAGPRTREAFIKSLSEHGLGVICGGEMTHKGYKAREEGYITDVAPVTIYRSAVKQGVTDFVVPANKTDSVGFYRMLLESSGIVPTLYLVGLVDQGGSIREAGKTAGPYWHAICGTAIYNPNKKESLDKVTEEEMHESIKKLAMSL